MSVATISWEDVRATLTDGSDSSARFVAHLVAQMIDVSYPQALAYITNNVPGSATPVYIVATDSNGSFQFNYDHVPNSNVKHWLQIDRNFYGCY